jgi:hypothetical protein
MSINQSQPCAAESSLNVTYEPRGFFTSYWLGHGCFVVSMAHDCGAIIRPK